MDGDFEEAWRRMHDDAMRAFDAATNRRRRPWESALVTYAKRDRSVALNLPVIVPAGPGWEQRAAMTARIVGELHFALYDL